jgi:hypothetical protein
VVGHELLRRVAHTATIHQASTTAMIRTPLQVFLARFTVIAALVVIALRPAQAQFVFYTLPPPEYDKPYEGELIEYRGDKAFMEKTCPKISWLNPPLGCALHGPTHYHDTTKCTIWIANDDILTDARTSYDAVRRHELGHCNGWPSDHPDARPIPGRCEWINKKGECIG